MSRTKSKLQITPKIKEEISKIFGDKCFFCNMDLKNCDRLGKKHFHHIIPECCGGVTNQTNLVLCCWDCHSKIHKKVSYTYRDIRQIFYTILCAGLKISPMQSGLDDDLYSVGLEYEKGNRNIPENWKLLYLSLKRLDYEIGNLLNNFKVKDMLELGGLDKNELFGEMDFIKMQKIIQKLIKDKQNNTEPKGEETNNI